MGLFKSAKMGFGKRVPLKRKYGNKPVAGTFDGVTYEFRSKAEYNWACWCQLRVEQEMIGSWKYEEKRVHFQDQKRNPRSYLPDFWIYDKEGKLIRVEEVKGMLDGRSRSQFRKWNKEGGCPIHLVLLDFTVVNANGRRLAEEYCERIINMKRVLGPLKGFLDFI